MKYKHYVYHISYIDHTDNQSLKILKTKMSRTNTSYSKVYSNIKDSEKKWKPNVVTELVKTIRHI